MAAEAYSVPKIVTPISTQIPAQIWPVRIRVSKVLSVVRSPSLRLKWAGRGTEGMLHSSEGPPAPLDGMDTYLAGLLARGSLCSTGLPCASAQVTYSAGTVRIQSRGRLQLRTFGLNPSYLNSLFVSRRFAP